MAHPLCPFCYEGEIVEDDKEKGRFFCNRCFKTIEIRKKKNSFIRHL